MSLFDVKLIPSALVESLKGGKCGAYIGAGLSQSVGLPSWRELLEELIDEAAKLVHVTDSMEAELRKLLDDSTKHLLLASELKDLLADNFRKYLQTRFARNCPRPGSVHKALLDAPLKYILTTNYDTLLERALTIKHQGDITPLVYDYSNAQAAAMSLWDDSFFILKLHGDAQRTPNDIVLSELDYRKIIYRQPGFQSLLQTIFTTSTIVFLGASITDIDLKLVLSYLHNAFHCGGPTHYALFPQDHITGAEVKRWLHDYNIQIIGYDPRDNHADVENFIVTLTNLATGATS